MNPYLENEDVWHDFHERFVPAIAEWLGPQIQPNYFVRIDQHAYIHELPAEERRLAGRPDAAITDRRARGREGVSPLAVDIEKQAFLEIRDRVGRQVITVIEVLSPSNKRPGADREQYLGKREDFVRSNVNLVEIDLLRCEPRLPVEGLPPCDYYVMVSRPNERPDVGLWPIALHDPLPTITVPLREGEPGAKLDLQAVLNRVYDAAQYELYIYAQPPQPPLKPADENWAKRLIS